MILKRHKNDGFIKKLPSSFLKNAEAVCAGSCSMPGSPIDSWWSLRSTIATTSIVKKAIVSKNNEFGGFSNLETVTQIPDASRCISILCCNNVTNTFFIFLLNCAPVQAAHRPLYCAVICAWIQVSSWKNSWKSFKISPSFDAFWPEIWSIKTLIAADVILHF